MPDSPYGDIGIPLAHTGPVEATVLTDIEIFGTTIPAGYVTDGASVPFGRARYTDLLPAAIVHDFRYDPVPDDRGIKQRTMTRKEADMEFLHNLKACGISWTRRRAAYRAVRLFGWRPWNAGTERGTLNP